MSRSRWEGVVAALTGRDPALRLDTLTIGRAGHDPVLGGLTVEVPTHRLVAVAGQPGFGGTLLAQTVAGVRKPAGGRVDVPDTAFIPSGGGLLPQLSLRRNVVFGERLRGHTGAASTDRWPRRFRSRWTLTRDDERDVDRLLERFGLADIRHRVPDWVNGTQRLLTALARALLRRPEAIVVDATSGPDPDFAYTTMLAALKDLIADQHTGVLLCTNRPALLRACDHITVVGDVPAGRAGTAGDGAPPPCRGTVAAGTWAELRADRARSVVPVLHGDPLLMAGDRVWVPDDIRSVNPVSGDDDGGPGRRFTVVGDPDPGRFQDVRPEAADVGGPGWRLRLPPGEAEPRGSTVVIEFDR